MRRPHEQLSWAARARYGELHGGQGRRVPGIAANSLKCGDFPIADIQAAARQVVPTATAGPDKAKLSSGDGCLFAVFTPGTDTTSSNSGEVGIVLTINDSYEPSAGSTDLAVERAAFEEARNVEPHQDTSHTVTQSGITGLGDEAYLVDTVNTGNNTSGSVVRYQDEIYVLHNPRPYSFFLSTD
jgi:hypothetical protein